MATTSRSMIRYGTGPGITPCTTPESTGTGPANRTCGSTSSLNATSRSRSVTNSFSTAGRCNDPLPVHRPEECQVLKRARGENEAEHAAHNGPAHQQARADCHALEDQIRGDPPQTPSPNKPGGRVVHPREGGGGAPDNRCKPRQGTPRPFEMPEHDGKQPAGKS